VAFWAETVRVDELPAAIEVEFAEMETVGGPEEEPVTV
jgi:hypothetical protein